MDVVALSVLSGAHTSMCQEVIRGLKEAGADDVTVILGGTILKEEVPSLEDMGVAEIFPPGSPLDAGVRFLQGRFQERPDMEVERG